ncbi:BPSL1445 family SYLF domain-containing lipoprotein [Rivibacter subsaxonicus]|uniref:Las17-binding protein actin regulator n=1 Tax=Rivibacter subsaxonicus TaxID=457575 RepID=A0A4V2FTG4_9BURK|nr:YSC84-related protein [Rivibacter subsaxonicus]RZT98075.1 Las17-binding protein actin regulator [Rivibacter subsaxonicus]
MDKRTFLVAGASVAAVSLLSAGCTTTTSASSDPQARRNDINTSVDRALSNLYTQVGGSEELVKSARGVLVFPSVIAAGLGVGGATGEGAMREAGVTTGFFRTSSLSVGLIAGAQSTAVIYLFMTQEALAKFNASRGWQVGVDAGVTLISVGTNARVDTRSVQQPIVAFVLTNAGLMANLTLDGTRINRLDL